LSALGVALPTKASYEWRVLETDAGSSLEDLAARSFTDLLPKRRTHTASSAPRTFTTP
jgi:hypothetical protein